MPYTPETGAMDLIAMDMNHYRDMRDAAVRGAGDTELKAIEDAYRKDEKRILQLLNSDGIDMKDFKREHNRVFANIVMRYPEAAKCYGFVSAETAECLREDSFRNLSLDALKSQVKKTESWYTDEEGRTHTGYSYEIEAEDGLLRDAKGRSFAYGTRRRYEPSEYTEFFSKTMKGALDEIYDRVDAGMDLDEASKNPGADSLKSKRMTSEIAAMMLDDGFDDFMVQDIMNAARSLYLDGRYQENEGCTSRQDDKGHEDEKQPGDDGREQPVDKQGKAPDKEESMIFGENNGMVVAFDSYGTPQRVYGTYQPQGFMAAGFSGDVSAIEPTFSHKDTHMMAELCARLQDDIAVNNPGIARVDIVESTVSYESAMAAKGISVTCRDFLEKSVDMKLSEDGKQLSDLIGVCLYTDAPALMKDADGNDRLVATRSLNGSMKIGEVGAVLGPGCEVKAGCFADSSVKLHNCELSAPSGKPLYISMKSELTDCKVSGDGVIANTFIKDAEIFGTFDPYHTRKECGSPQNVMSRLTIGKDGRDYFGHGQKQQDTVNPKYMKSMRGFYSEQQKARHEKELAAESEKREAERLRKQAEKEKEVPENAGKKGEEDIRSRVRAVQGMRQTKAYNDADDIEGAARRRAASTPGGMDNIRAKGVAEHIMRDGVNSSQTVDSVIQEANEYMRKSTSESMQMGS